MERSMIGRLQAYWGTICKITLSLIVRTTLTKEQDGILGVHSGVEMLKVLDEGKIETHFPVGVVNWTK